MKKFAAALIGFATLTGAASAQELKVKPGLWETTNNIFMEFNMGGQSMKRPMNTGAEKECITPDKAVFSPQSLARDGCTASNVKSSGTSLSFDMTCSQDGMTFTGSMSYTLAADRQSGSGTMNMQGQTPNGPVKMSGTMSGKRIGDC